MHTFVARLNQQTSTHRLRNELPTALAHLGTVRVGQGNDAGSASTTDIDGSEERHGTKLQIDEQRKN